MDKKTYTLTLQAALFYFEGIKKETLISEHGIDSEIVTEGIKVCEMILNDEYQKRYDKNTNSRNCAICGILLSKEEKRFFTIDERSFCQDHYNQTIKKKRDANEMLNEIEK